MCSSDVIRYAQRFQVNLHFLRLFAHTLSHTHAHALLSLCVSLSVCVLCVPFSRFFPLFVRWIFEERDLFFSLWGKKEKVAFQQIVKTLNEHLQ